VWAAGYDAFGEATVTTGAPPPVSLGFQAMFTEPLTGVVDMGARTYDPSTGRFTQPDTVIGALTTPISLNRYLYAHADPLSMFDPDGRWPFSLSGLIDAAIGFVDQATDAFHHLASAAGQVAAGLASDLSQLSDRARQAVDSAGESLASLAAQTAAGISEYWDRHGDQVTDTLTGVAVGAAIGGGCIALGIATAGIGGAVCAGAALGAVIGAAMCDDDRTAIGCAATGAIAGGVAGLTGGLAASAGAGGFTVGALSGLTGDATEQLLSTGTIDTRRLAAAALTGGALGWLGGRLANRSGLTLTSRGFGVSSGYRPVVVRPPSSPQVRPLARTRTCQHSFDPETEVLMADGTTRQIQHVRVGDKVIATDPETGRTSVEEVTATHANEDRDLTNLTVEDGDGNRSVVSTTWTHPFWSEDRERWVNASQLVPGERLRTAETGDSAFVVSTDNHVGDEAMRDLTVADTHTYHVMASDTPVLVHNCHGAYDWEPANRPGLATEPQGRLPEGSWIRPGEALTPGGSYHYVVMRNGSLRAMEEEAMWAIDDSAGHTSLAGNQPVHMAGMFEVDELGRIAMFDNWSGHYGPRNMPAYTPLEDIARAAFQKHRLPAPGPNSWELKSFW
jgi:RHS repeat-associated protein